MDNGTRSDMDLHQLSIFTSVYRNLSFSRASEQLSVSQPTISEHIKNLETELGCLLFNRLGRSILPTQQAEAMYPMAMHILEEAEKLKQSVASSGNTVKGEITIAASTTPGSYILPELCNRFRQINPEVSFRVLIEDSRGVTDMILRHEVLLGVVGSIMDHDRLRHEPFRSDELVLVANPSMGLKRTISAKDLTGVPIILREEGSGTRKTFEEHLKAKGIRTSALNVTAVLGATDAVKEAVKSALGTSVLSRISVREELERGQLMEISIRGIRMPRTFHLISHKKRVLPQPYSAFMEFAVSSK